MENVMALLLIGGLQKKEAKSKALELIDGIVLKDRATRVVQMNELMR